MHTHFPKNKKVLLIYKDGRQEVVRWWMADGKFIKLMDHEPVRIDKLRAITYYRTPSPRLG